LSTTICHSLQNTLSPSSLRIRHKLIFDAESSNKPNFPVVLQLTSVLKVLTTRRTCDINPQQSIHTFTIRTISKQHMQSDRHFIPLPCVNALLKHCKYM